MSDSKTSNAEVQVLDKVCDFTHQAGSNYITGQLVVDGFVTIDGEEHIEKVIQGEHHAKCFSITLTPTGTAEYGDYKISVTAKGKSHLFDGNWYLYFIDETDDKYELAIYRHEKLNHVLRYKSAKPTIKTIRWSNKSE